MTYVSSRVDFRLIVCVVQRYLGIMQAIPPHRQSLAQCPFVLALLDGAAVHTSLFLTGIPSGAHGHLDGPTARYLLARDKVARTEHLDVVPPLHHVLMAARAEGVAVRGPAKDGRAARKAHLPVALAFEVELVRARGGRAGRRAERAEREEERELGRRTLFWVRGWVLVQPPRRRKHEVRLVVRTRPALPPLQVSRVHREHALVRLRRVLDRLRVAERRLRVEQVVRACSEFDPLAVGCEGGHGNAQRAPRLLYGFTHSRLPFFERLPGRLNGADDALFKVSRALLHDNNTLLKGVFFDNLRER